jgi:hypothetical protein
LKKEYLLLFLSVVISLVAALGLIKWLAPQLLGLPADLQLVQVPDERPPFYENIFHSPGWNSDKIILKDPFTRVRARPFYQDIEIYGPNDLLGFRNSSVPTATDIVVIGDSQTYGNNASMQNSWPQQMRDQLGMSGIDVSVYTMAAGGWGAVQYLEMARYGLLFRPQMMIVAFYTGNDPMDTFITAYGMERWKSLRPESNLSAEDAPKAGTSLTDEKARWKVKFSDGISTEFNPDLRMVSNQSHPAIDAAYRIMLNVAQQIAELANQQGIKPVFTIIPTKEYVYQDKISRQRIDAIPEYHSLIEAENKRVEWFAEGLSNIEQAGYIDVATPLRHTALMPRLLYPENVNGHPFKAGYALLGKLIAGEISDDLAQNKIDDGVIGVMLREAPAGSKVPVRIALKKGNAVRLFESMDLASKYGWRQGKLRLLSHLQYLRLQRLPDITVENFSSLAAGAEQK